MKYRLMVLSGLPTFSKNENGVFETLNNTKNRLAEFPELPQA
jgi:hypothetical protein